jgi:hypothetical protein
LAVLKRCGVKHGKLFLLTLKHVTIDSFPSLLASYKISRRRLLLIGYLQAVGLPIWAARLSTRPLASQRIHKNTKTGHS